MAYFARIENETVREIIQADARPVFHPDIEIVEVSEQTREGWVRSGGVIVDPETLKTVQEVKAERIAEVSALRDSKYAAGMVYNGKTYQVDLEAQKDMTAIMLQFALGNSNPHGGAWRTAENEAVSMDDTAVQTFIQTAFAYIYGIKNASWLHKESLNNLNAKQDILDYNIESGWPDNG